MRLNISLLPLLLTLGLSCLGISLLYVMHQGMTRAQLIANEQHHLETDLMEQHSLLQLYLMKNDVASLKNWTSLKSESPHVLAVMIVDPQQNIVAAHQVAIEGDSLKSYHANIAAELATLPPQQMVKPILLSGDTNELMMALPLQFAKEQGWLVLQYDLHDALTSGLAITLQNMLVYLVSMLLSGFLTFLLLRKILHLRLRRLELTLNQYSAGSHDARAEVNDNNEFGRLELMLNRTLDALDQQRTFSQHTMLFNQLVLNSTTDGIVSTDNLGRILQVNQAGLKIFGYQNADELTGQDLHLLVPHEHRQDHRKHLVKREAQPSGHFLNRLRQVEGLRKDGSKVPLDITLTQASLEGQLIYIAFLKDNTEQRHYQRSIEQLAFTDELTGAANLHGLKRSLQENPALNWMYLLNVDGMANLNNSFGFTVGDLLIQAFYRMLQQRLGSDHILARNQGAEFILLSNKPPAYWLDEFQALQGSELHLVGFTVKLSFCTTFQLLQTTETIETQLHSAEIMMRQAKSAGRGSMLQVDPGLIQQLQTNAFICHQLDQAIRDEQLFFHYQPKFAALSRLPVSAEALLRWQLNGQFISPGIFIPLAEQSHLMPQLDRLVIKQACRQIRAWLDNGWQVMPISINLSARHLVDDSTIAYIFEKVGEFDIPAQLLEVEVTEYSLIEDETHTAENMHRLIKAGIGIAIDDYGTGHSNLATVLSLPVQNLKIDQSFIRKGMSNSKGRAILENILQLAKSLQVTTTAEGVETEEQLAFLQKSGCEYIQGYLLSKPLPLAEFELIMKSYGTQEQPSSKPPVLTQAKTTS
ncbi:MAG: EAL domain-containing protein [Rheinheimera sp.]|nr:EAL domain-containing protein [Rheinheimera sp.]